MLCQVRGGSCLVTACLLGHSERRFRKSEGFINIITAIETRQKSQDLVQVKAKKQENGCFSESPNQDVGCEHRLTEAALI